MSQIVDKMQNTSDKATAETSSAYAEQLRKI